MKGLDLISEPRVFAGGAGRPAGWLWPVDLWGGGAGAGGGGLGHGGGGGHHGGQGAGEAGGEGGTHRGHPGMSHVISES